MSIKIDMSKVKIEDYINWMTYPNDLEALLVVLDSAVEGGASHRPATELPAILAKFGAAINEIRVDTDLALGSLINYLKDKQDD